MSIESELYANKVFFSQAHRNVVSLMFSKEHEFDEDGREKLQEIYRNVVKIEMLLYDLQGIDK